MTINGRNWREMLGTPAKRAIGCRFRLNSEQPVPVEK
jgi:hypothetical protein